MKRLNSSVFLTALIGPGFLLAAVLVHASSFTVSPTRISLSDKQMAITVRLVNTGEEAVTVQAHVMAWGLANNEDDFEDSDDVLLNPPIFTLQPQRPQLMRLGLRKMRPADKEIAYRLIVEEVPPPPASGARTMRMILRIAIPIFVAPRDGERKKLEWKAQALPSGAIKIVAANTGNVHVQMRRIDLIQPGSKDAPFSTKNLDYLLPGKIREWVFDDKQIAYASKLLLKVATDAGDINESLAITSR